MSAVAEVVDLKELNDRIAAGDAEIASKSDALEGLKADYAARGVTAGSITIEESKALVAAQKEIDGLKDDVIVLRDLRSASFNRAAPQVGNREAGRRMSSFHELLMNDPSYGALTPERVQGSINIGNMPSVPVLDREAAIHRLQSGGRLFAAGPQAVAVSTDLDAGIPLDERLFPPVEILTRRIRLLDLITVGATDSDTIVFVRQTQRDSAAAETDLGVAYGEADYDFEQATSTVRDIGHFTTMHRSQIADAGQFDTIVRNQLQEDVLLRLESQIYAGDGVGVNLSGLTTQVTASVTRDTTNETRIDCAHRAITTVRNAFREPTAFVVHPNDYQEIVLEKDGAERHLLSGMTGPGPAFAPYMSLWGLPLVVTPVATEGVGMVGYWPDATLWVRSGVSLAVSDSHDDYFIKRQVAVLAEMRGAFSVTRPAGFCEINLI